MAHQENFWSDCMRRMYTLTKTYTVYELANVLGVRVSALKQAEREHFMPECWLYRLEKQYGVSSEWILTGCEEKRQRSTEYSPNTIVPAPLKRQ